MSLSSLRRALYRGARTLGDISAAAKGPTPYVKRRVRRVAYRKTNSLLTRALRKGGLL